MSLISQNKGKSFVLEFTFGGTAAFISKTIASPIQVIKLRLQVQYALIQKGMLTHRYEGISDCFERLYKQNGVRTFFYGNATNALRFFLTQALNFSFRDLFRNILGQMTHKNKQELTFVQNIAAGGAAGASTQLITYPLDYARTRLANQIKGKQSSKSLHFNGLIDCLIKTKQSDGVIGLYRGFTISCICMVIYRGLYFGIYDSLRPFVSNKYQKNMLVTFSLGYFATILSGAVSYPLDTVRRRMMMTSGQQAKFNTLQCIKRIYGEGGWRSFFRGGAANIVGGLTGAAVLSFYDRLKLFYQQKYGYNR